MGKPFGRKLRPQAVPPSARVRARSDRRPAEAALPGRVAAGGGPLAARIVLGGAGGMVSPPRPRPRGGGGRRRRSSGGLPVARILERLEHFAPDRGEPAAPPLVLPHRTHKFPLAVDRLGSQVEGPTS